MLPSDVARYIFQFSLELLLPFKNLSIPFNLQLGWVNYINLRADKAKLIRLLQGIEIGPGKLKKPRFWTNFSNRLA